MHLLEEQRTSDFGPRKSFQKKNKNNGSLISSCHLPFLIVDSLSRKSFSYDKLPQEPLKLIVIKLDGASFQIEVVKTGTVARLKGAVEAVFSHLPKNGPRRVSWPFVWGHFCLCYNGQKLLNDTDEIGTYGIKDGDKLHFVRHVSISYTMVKEISGEEELDLDETPKSEALEDRHLRSQEVEKHKERDIENQQDVHADNEDRQLATGYGHKLANLFRGWFSYRKLPTSDVRRDEHGNSFGFSLSSLGSFKDLVIYSGKYDFQRVTNT